MDSSDRTEAPVHTYLLRFWREPQQAAPAVWRFVLIEPRTGKRVGFQSTDALHAHLQSLLSAADDSARPDA